MNLIELREKSKTFEFSEDLIKEREARRVSFVDRFPKESIAQLTIDEYVQGANNDSFCYWLEFKKIYMGIGGGNAYKFGLYKHKEGIYNAQVGKEKKQLDGAELEKHFAKIIQGLTKAINFHEAHQIDEILALDIPVWNMVLQKVLGLYFPNDYLAIGSAKVLIACAKDIGVNNVELVVDNLIKINYECHQLLRKQPEFRDWHYEKLSTFIWENYKNEPNRNYYVIGSKYENNIDVFPKMFEQSVVSVGFAPNIDLTDLYGANQKTIVDFLKEKGEESASYSALKYLLALKPGDRIAIKADGSPKGKAGFLSIVGIAEVVQQEGQVYQYDAEGLKHLISVKFIHAPVYKELNLGGYGRTIHKLSKDDHIDLIFNSKYTTITLAESQSEFKRFLSKFNPKHVGTYFSFLREIIKHFGLEYGDPRLVFSIADNKRLNFTIGQRYVLNLFLSHEKGKFGVASTQKLNKDSESYTGSKSAPFYNFYDELVLNDLEKQSVFDVVKTELERTTKSSFRKHSNTDFETYVFGVSPKKNNVPMIHALNTILHGPPGTGKTYNTILMAAEIVKGRKIDEYEEALKIFNDLLHDQIEFITFHQNYSYEDFIQGLRPDTDNGQQLTFERKDGIFKAIADRAMDNYTLSEKDSEDVSKEVLFDEALGIFIDEIQEREENYQIGDTVAYITEVTENAFRYKGENWGNGQLMKFKDLKMMYREDIQDRQDIKKLTSVSGLAKQHASYFIKVYHEILNRLPETTVNQQLVEKKNYVIVIDEINRANISRVFGELITLIEPDKRSHGKIPMEVKLPSGDLFKVPSNLYIIGTMNTADKSISLLDIALRRRFEFLSMYPKYEIEGKVIYDVDILQKINQEIISSKGHDFQIGHAYFMDDKFDLVTQMNKKVIPLLLEYYMNDKKEVERILINSGLVIEKNSWPLRIIGKA